MGKGDKNSLFAFGKKYNIYIYFPKRTKRILFDIPNIISWKAWAKKNVIIVFCYSECKSSKLFFFKDAFVRDKSRTFFFPNHSIPSTFAFFLHLSSKKHRTQIWVLIFFYHTKALSGFHKSWESYLKSQHTEHFFLASFRWVAEK